MEIVYLILLLVVCFVCIGVLLKVLMLLLSILAFPTYCGAYAFLHWVPQLAPYMKLPKDKRYKVIMDIFGSAVTMAVVWIISQAFHLKEKFFAQLMAGQVMGPASAVISLICFAGIFVFSYLARKFEKDKEFHDPVNQLDSLEMPSIFRKFFDGL